MAKILLIEDSLFMKELIVHTLRDEKHEIIHAKNGAEGLELIHSWHPDCIILDLVLPDIPGTDIIKTLHSQKSAIPVIVLTANIQKTAERQCKELGVEYYLQKPPDKAELSRSIRQVLMEKGEGLHNYIDAIQELFNIGIGKAAAIINDILDVHINIKVVSARVLSFDTYKNELLTHNTSGYFSAVRMKYENSFSGIAALVFPPDSANRVFSLITRKIHSAHTQTVVKPETLSEVGNILLNGIMGSISNILGTRLSFSVPEYIENKIEHILEIDEFAEGLEILVGEICFEIKQHEIVATTIIVMKSSSFSKLIVGLKKLTLK